MENVFQVIKPDYVTLEEALDTVKELEEHYGNRDDSDNENTCSEDAIWKEKTICSKIDDSVKQLGMNLILELPSFATSESVCSSSVSSSPPPSSSSSFLLSLTPPASYSMSTTSSTYAPILTYDIIRYGTQLTFAESFIIYISFIINEIFTMFIFIGSLNEKEMESYFEDQLSVIKRNEAERDFYWIKGKKDRMSELYKSLMRVISETLEMKYNNWLNSQTDEREYMKVFIHPSIF